MQYAQISDLNIVTNLCIFYIDFYSHWLYNVYKLKWAVFKLIADKSGSNRQVSRKHCRPVFTGGPTK